MDIVGLVQYIYSGMGSYPPKSLSDPVQSRMDIVGPIQYIYIGWVATPLKIYLIWFNPEWILLVYILEWVATP